MTITCHGEGRIRERSIMRALQKGLRPEESTGNLRWYFDHLRRFEREGAVFRLYGHHVYIFSGDTLITVLTLPSEYKNEAEQAMSGRNLTVVRGGDIS